MKHEMEDNEMVAHGNARHRIIEVTWQVSN